MYYMESSSTGNSLIPVNLVLIKVVMFAQAYFHLNSSTSPRETDSEIVYIIKKVFINCLPSLIFSQHANNSVTITLYMFLTGFWCLFYL